MGSSTAQVKRFAHLSLSHLDAGLESVAAFWKDREPAAGEAGKGHDRKGFLLEPDQKPERRTRATCGQLRKWLKGVELARGIEPPTCGLQNRCSAD